MKLPLQFSGDANHCRRYMVLCFTAAALAFCLAAKPPDTEFNGRFEQLVSNEDDREQVVFKPAQDLSKFKFSKAPGANATITAGRLYHALSDKSAIVAVLVEPQNEDPYLLADVDMNGELGDKESFAFSRETEDNPLIWQVTVKQPLNQEVFQSFPLLVRYLKRVRTGSMKEGDRLIIESRSVLARGLVEIQGKKTLVQYEYNARSRKINLNAGKLGVDCNQDGEVEMEALSPEAAEANDESVIFRVGNVYVSTKKVDLEKNLITMRSHSPSDYKRIELRMGEQIPEIEFTDFNNKKRKLSEFRGKYLLIDFWGMWCPPCRQELPYLRAAYQRFQTRGFEILGMNTDQPEIVSQIKSQLEKNGMTWPQAKRESIIATIRNLRIHSYPTTVLVGPDGKILSLNSRLKDQPQLRGEDLLESLDRLLPR